MGATQRANRLVHETSPYLLQHAHNPVDWYPWGPEALEAARAANKPIFLSIGYSACHWCHVMERESFEDEATAAIMNEHFINIKVDREERPDLDQIYMTAVQLITQHGGWPMSVWLTPDLEPFYGGTYFPPEPRYGMPSFKDVLRGVAQAWESRREEVLQSAGRLAGHIREIGGLPAGEGPVGPGAIDAAARQLAGMVDRTWGGLGRAPKFPHSVEMRLLFRAHARTGKDDERELALLTLEKMIHGGIYDQLGGGFHRYSTDQRWLVPHFEKMLYDNALVPLACLEAYQLTGRDLFARAVVETMDYVLREMTSPEGGFFSTQDADSEGVEGKYFVWSHEEVMRILGPEKGKAFAYCYDVTPEGNWEHANILNLPKPIDQAARMLGVEPETLRKTLAECRCALFGERRKRIAPGRDEKILAAWNGMMIETMAASGAVLEKSRYTDAAVQAAEFVLARMRRDDGLLFRTYKDGQAKLNAYCEDYAFLANGLVSLYEATFDPRWLEEACSIVGALVEQFWDEKDGGFFFVGEDHEKLIARSKEPSDGATPSGNAVAATAMARLAKLTGRGDLAAKVDRTLGAFHSVIDRSPMGAAQMLIALGVHSGPTVEIAIVGEPESPDARAMLRAIHRRYLPNKVIACGRDGMHAPGLLEGKTAVGGAATVYLCRNFACQQPITDLGALEAELDRLAAPGAAAASVP